MGPSVLSMMVLQVRGGLSSLALRHTQGNVQTTVESRPTSPAHACSPSPNQKHRGKDKETGN
jgi:hypothetical protein